MPEAQQQQQQQQQQAAGTPIWQSALQSIAIFIGIQFVAKQFMGGPAANTTAAGGAVTNSAQIPEFFNRPQTLAADAQYNPIPQRIAPIWSVGTELDVRMYISPSIIMPSLKSMPSDSLLLKEEAFKYGDYKDERPLDTTFRVPKEVQNNQTLWAHFYIGQHGAELDPTSPRYDPGKAYHMLRPLTQYMKRKPKKNVRNLLSAVNETQDAIEDAEPTGPQFASYYHPNFTLSFIPDSGIIPYLSMHPALRQFTMLETTGARDSTGQNGWYYPVLYLNTFWQMKEYMTELNDTVKELPMHVKLNNLANWKYSLYASVDEGQKQQRENAAQGQASMGGDGSEFDEFKRILLDSNPILLGTTFVVSILHMIFEGLAFKNDVSHWRKKKDNVGTSFRTIMANVVMQTIIFLYLMDNNENTSWMILFSQGMGIAIEAWKVTKTVNVRVRETPAGSKWPFPYMIAFEDKHKLTEQEEKTAEYDRIAFRYLYLVAIPLLLAYAGYSVYYESHKSWYSFIITTLVGSVYAYGFLMMVPSLYINYRLKSVAHMPGRAMTYKFLNTFIDDLFAFTIKMPTLHRLATLRDDVIFFIYLYQMWVYKVDYSRVNEFGQGGDDEEVEEKKANQPIKAPADGKAITEGVEAAKGANAKLNETAAKATGKAKESARKRK